MDPSADTLLLALCIFAAAVLYSSVGHAGASGYLAAMALFSLESEQMKPAALVMNIAVATIGTIRFMRAGAISWPLLWPFAVASVPMAFVGGAWRLPVPLYKTALGVALLIAAANLLLRFNSAAPDGSAANPPSPQPPAIWKAMITGGLIGLLAGMTGTGGGIFLSPLLILLNWADPRRTAGVSVAFILVNSISGLGGHLASLQSLPGGLVWWLPAAVVGGFLGSGLGARRLGQHSLRRVLGVVLIIAGGKMLLT